MTISQKTNGKQFLCKLAVFYFRQADDLISDFCFKKTTDFQLFLIQLLNKCCLSSIGFQVYLTLNIPFMDSLKEDSRGKEQEENSSFLEGYSDLIEMYWWGCL